MEDLQWRFETSVSLEALGYLMTDFQFCMMNFTLWIRIMNENQTSNLNVLSNFVKRARQNILRAKSRQAFRPPE